MPHIVIATHNAHKFRELKALLSGGARRLPWRSLKGLRGVPSVRETGRTFEANAAKKARMVARALRCLALADDSGLEVRALQGAPGVRSARFAGRHGDDEANNTKVLRLLQGLPASKRGARFRCSLALASPRGLLAVTNGALVGRIATRRAGQGGFGYDSIFVIPRLKKTVAQLPAATKNRISHRYQAAHRMQEILKTLDVDVRSLGQRHRRAGTSRR